VDARAQGKRERVSALEAAQGSTAAASDRHASRRARRRWLVFGGGALGLFVALALLGAFSGEPGGPASSSYATGDRGAAAWATLLSRTGHPVGQLRESLSKAALLPQETIVLLEPDALLHSEGTRLVAFVRAGGRLVYGSSQPRRTLPALLYSPPVWSARGPSRYTAVAAKDALAASVGEVRTAGEGSWSSFAGYASPVGAPDGNALLLRRQIGAGTLELLSDVSPFQNRLLASADNAQLALNVAGPPGRAVVFVESVHGYGAGRGLAALPPGWLLAFAVLGLAGLLWIAARARRLGPAEQSVELLPPARSAYADAVALLLRRTKDQQAITTALERLRER
jgi:hypothetical protein